MHKKITKQQQLNTLYEPYKKCIECPLGNLGRTNVVFGSGNPDAKLMLIGEAPGKEEDLLNSPFVGKSGQLLNKALSAAGINREDIFITNVVKCRPPKNRNPTPAESTTCTNLLLFNQIKIIDPLVICTLGSIAAQTLLKIKNVKITKIHGCTYDIEARTIMPTFHPAYMLRNPKKLELLINDLILAQKFCEKLRTTQNRP